MWWRKDVEPISMKKKKNKSKSKKNKERKENTNRWRRRTERRRNLQNWVGKLTFCCVWTSWIEPSLFTVSAMPISLRMRMCSGFFRSSSNGRIRVGCLVEDIEQSSRALQRSSTRCLFLVHDALLVLLYGKNTYSIDKHWKLDLDICTFRWFTGKRKTVNRILQVINCSCILQYITIVIGK